MVVAPMMGIVGAMCMRIAGAVDLAVERRRIVRVCVMPMVMVMVAAPEMRGHDEPEHEHREPRDGARRAGIEHPSNRIGEHHARKTSSGSRRPVALLGRVVLAARGPLRPRSVERRDRSELNLVVVTSYW